MKKLYWIALKSIWKKEINRFMRIWSQTILPPVITIILYFIIFGNLIGSQIKNINNFTYMQFIVPGLVMMSVINNSYSNVASSFFSSKFQRNIEELLIAPVPNYIIILGYIGGGIIRGIFVGCLVMSVSIFFAPFSIKNWWVLAIILLLTSTLFSLAGLLNAIFAKTFDDISIIPTFILNPLIYLGGVFYSIFLLPKFWQDVSKLNPIMYIISAFRYGFLGIKEVPFIHTIIILVILIMIFYLLVWFLIKKGFGLKS